MPVSTIRIHPTATLSLNVWVKQQDVNSNRTLFGFHLYVTRTGAGYWSNYPAYWSVRAPYGNVISYGQINSYDLRRYNILNLVYSEIWLPHREDGSIDPLQWVGVFDDSKGNFGANTVYVDAVTAAPIPRATTAKLPPLIVTGTPVTVYLPRASSDFTHNVSCRIAGTIHTIAENVGVSTSWLPAHNIFDNHPTVDTLECVFTTTTYRAGQLVGETTSNTILQLNKTIKPEITDITISDANQTVATNIGAFVQGLSILQPSITAHSLHGAAITQTSTSIAGTPTPAEGIIPATSDPIEFTATAVDSRSRTATATAQTQILEYRPPELLAAGFNVQRANSSGAPDPEGEYLIVVCHAKAYSLKPDSSERNQLAIKIRTKAANSGWITRNQISPGLVNSATPFQITGGGVFSPDLSYTVEATLTDKTGTTVTVTTTISTAKVALDLNGTNVGIGKMHENGALDVAGEVHAHNFITPNGTLIPAATIQETIDGTNDSKAVTPAALATLYATNAQMLAGVINNRIVTPAVSRLLASGTITTNTGALYQIADTGIYGAPNIQITVPASISSNTQILIHAIETGTGYGTVTQIAQSRSGNATIVTLRFTQIANATPQTLKLVWQLVRT